MKKIYNAPAANEIFVLAQDVITASEIKIESSGDGETVDWDNG